MNMQERRQEIFNKVYVALKDQGFKKSTKNIDGNAVCAYRGDNGSKCAIGHLIDDDTAIMWDNACGDTGIVGIWDQYEDWYGGDFNGYDFPFVADDVDFLSDLQYCHDGANAGNGMRQNLIDFAAENKFEVPNE